MWNKLLPLHDQLYIFQNLEYNAGDFLKWWGLNFFRRDLQKKHHLKLTSKARLLLGLSYLLIIVESSIMAAGVNAWWSWPIWVVIFEQFSPVFILISQLLLWPIEQYQRSKLLSAAKAQRSSLKKLTVVGIAGSFAKTSIKDMLYTLLWKDFYVVKTPKSYNTELSIAETIVRDLKPTTEIFLCEMDAYHPGEIRQLAQLAQPDLGMITAIAPQHLERFGSMEKLSQAQFEIDQALPTSGKLFLNAIDQLSNDLSAQAQHPIIWFGGEGQVSFTHLKQTAAGLEFKLHHGKESVEIQLPLHGAHQANNFCAAAAMALELGMSLKKIADRAAWMLPTPHRLEVTQQGAMTLIDNTYNTNPTASQAAFDLLNALPGDQKILITPGLVELGSESETENRDFGVRAAAVADQIVVVGQNAKAAIKHGLKQANYPAEQIHFVDSTTQGLKLLPAMVKGKAVVLLENDLPDQYR